MHGDMVTFVDCIDPRELPDMLRTTLSLPHRRYKAVCNTDPYAAELALTLKEVLAEPLGVYEAVAIAANSFEGWLFVGVPTHYFAYNASAERTETRTFPAGRQLIVKVDKEMKVFNWLRTKPILDARGNLLKPVPGFGRCLFPVGAVA